MANFCTNCGHPIEGNAAFCRYCGAPLTAAPAAPAQQQPQQYQQPAQQYQQQPQQYQQQPQYQQPPAQPQYQQPQQPWTPAQQPQQQGQWSPPRTQQGAAQQSAQPWNQPTAANEWHAAPIGASGSAGRRSAPPISVGINARVGGKVWSTRTGPAVSPAQAVTDAVEDWQDRRRGTAQPMTNSGIPAPGWSARINDPEVLAGLAKNRRASKKFGAILVPLPLVGFAVYGAVSDKMEFPKALLYGAIVSVIFLIFALIGNKQSDPKNSYEGVVTDKQTHQRRRADSDGNGRKSYNYYTELVTVVRTDAGQAKRITERDDGNHPAWDYLQIGERFRYHAQLAFPYELWDKSHAPYLACPVCGKKHQVTEDRCRKCGAPLLK